MSDIEQPLSIVIYPQSNLLLHHPQVDQLVALVNDAYSERNKEFFKGNRVKDNNDLISELGDTALAVLISSHTVEPSFYAIGSARPYKEPMEPSFWTPRIPKDEAEEFERWELKMICTNTMFNRQGFGALLMDIFELEIKRRVRAQQRGGSTKKRRPQIVISAVEEVAGEFYQKRGFEICHKVHVGKGERMGRLGIVPNLQEFHIISMTKML